MKTIVRPAVSLFVLLSVVTGLLYVQPETTDLHDHLNTVDMPLNMLTENELCPGSAMLEKINAALR